MTGALEVVQGKVFDVIGIQDIAIAEMNQKALAITVNGIEDKVGLKECHDLRMVYVGQRNKVMKHGKAMRESAVKYQKDVIAEEKRIIDMMLVGETHLDTQEQAVKDELAKIKAEERRIEEIRIQGRRDQLAAMKLGFDGHTWILDSKSSGLKAIPDVMIRSFTDEQFSEQLTICNTMIAADRKLQEEEDAKRKEEEARIAKVAAEQETERVRLALIAAEQVDRENAIKAEEKRLADEKQRIIDEEAARVKAIEDARLKEIADKKRAEELEAARKEGEEKARLAAEAAAKKAEDERLEKERLAAEKEARRIARMPDRKAMINFLKAESVERPAPAFKTDEYQKILEDYRVQLSILVETFITRTEAM